MLAEYDFKALMAARGATRRRQPLASQQRRRHRSTGGRGVTVHHDEATAAMATCGGISNWIPVATTALSLQMATLTREAA